MRAVAASCVDTGKGCVPEWQWYWLWIGALVASLAFGWYWHWRSNRVQMFQALRDDFPAERSRANPRAAWAALGASVLIAAAVGIAARAFWLGVDVLFSMWGIAFALLLLNGDRRLWVNAFRDWYPDRRWYGVPVALLVGAVGVGIVAQIGDVNALEGVTAGLAAAASGLAAVIAARRALNHPQVDPSNSESDRRP